MTLALLGRKAFRARATLGLLQVSINDIHCDVLQLGRILEQTGVVMVYEYTGQWHQWMKMVAG